MSDLDVSVVIPVYNNAGTIEEQLDAVAVALTNLPESEVIVVDNRSTDGSSEVVTRWAATQSTTVKVVDAFDRAGEPYARNVGWRAASGRRVLFCDGDDVVAESWAAALVEGLGRWEYVTGPVSVDRLNDVDTAAVRGTAIFDGRPMLYDGVPFAHGCNMGFRRVTLERLGGFDESFLAGCDQVIAIRAWQHGIDLGFVDGGIVHYRLRGDLRSMFRQGRSYGRYRVKVRALTPELVDRTQLRNAQARRVGWLVKYSLPAVVSSNLRARWVWVVSQVVGEIRGGWEVRRDR